MRYLVDSIEAFALVWYQMLNVIGSKHWLQVQPPALDQQPSVNHFLEKYQLLFPQSANK